LMTDKIDMVAPCAIHSALLRKFRSPSKSSKRWQRLRFNKSLTSVSQFPLPPRALAWVAGTSYATVYLPLESIKYKQQPRP
jgi:hypothetical protein